MRYIDIIRTIVRNASEKDIPSLTWNEQRHHLNAIRRKIDDIEIVVRCKDCKYFHKSEMYSYCNKINIKGKSPKGIDFCSYGERRGGKDE